MFYLSHIQTDKMVNDRHRQVICVESKLISSSAVREDGESGW